MRKVISIDVSKGLTKIGLPVNSHVTKVYLKPAVKKKFNGSGVFSDVEGVVPFALVIIDDEMPEVGRAFMVIMNENPVPPGAHYIDSVIFGDQAVHLWEVRP
jgi:hypothetical protein